MIKTKKQSLIVIGVFALTILLGTTTYAFFNYTRTGTANNIRTGKIYFNADGGNNTVTLSDLFPISVGENETITSSTPGVGSLKLHITGDTTYTEGIEYLIEAVEVTGNGNTSLPISIDISYTPTEVEQGEDPNVIGTSDNNYFTNRGGETSKYKLLSNGSISEGEDILVGYIAPGATGIDGELTILAYLDADNIAITDTYDEDEPETDTNGTTTNWVNGRTVFTTEEWNALQATGVSFKIRATANEGTWVEEPAAPGTIPTCPGCKFMYTTTDYHVGEETETLTGVTNDYRTLNKNYFLGFTEVSGMIDKAYACGIKGEMPNEGVPFCIEGGNYGSTYASNNALLNNLYGPYDSTTTLGCNNAEYSLFCSGTISAGSDDEGTANVTGSAGGCSVNISGDIYCFES